jgi:biotinidase
LYITAIQVQEGWSRALDVNLLASGYDDPGNRNGGSGIYAGELGRLAATMPPSKTSKLLISQVPKKKRGLLESDWPGMSQTLQLEQQRPSIVESERIFFSDYLAPYTTQLLETTDTHTELCNRGLCCQFDIRTEGTAGKSQVASYRLAVFNGIRPLLGGRTAGIQVCAVISCNNLSLSSCGQTIVTGKELATFEFISVQMNSSRVNSVHMPTTLQHSILPLDARSYELTSRILSDDLTQVLLRTTKSIHNLWTFGIYAREYDLDGLPFTVAT